jgi:hypothetical protein
MRCAEARPALGALALGALEPDEQSAIADHLNHCRACRAELAELTELTPLLGRLSLADLPPDPNARRVAGVDDGPAVRFEKATADKADPAADPAAAPSADLLDRLLRRVALERAKAVTQVPSTGAKPPRALTRRARRGTDARSGTDARQGTAARRAGSPNRRRSAAFTAAVAALVLGAATLAGVAVHHGDNPAPVATASATDPTTHVAVRADLRRQAWGTALQVELNGLPPGQACRLLAVGRNGAVETVGSWTGTYSGWAKVNGVTAMTDSSLAGLRVVTPEGKVLVVVPVVS